MNIGIISTSKRINFQNLPNNTYLIFYVSKTKKNKKYLDIIINYMITNDCKEIIATKDIEPLIEKNNYKDINIYNTLSNIKIYSTNKKIITYNFSKKSDNLISFEKSASFRKDSSPNKTIKKIKNILKKEHYKVKEKGLRKSLRGSYSIRLQLNNGKGANGKGTTLKLAKASAYAELMERIQSNMLIKKRIATHKIDKNSNIYNSLLDKASNEYKKYFFTLDNIYFNVSEAKNIKTSKIENIPINAISSFCHTNGLASGNTFEEAVNQGIFEILERFCYQECLKGYNSIQNIDISNYPLTKNNIKSLNNLKKKGFKYYIKDCSLGKFPVIGFLLFDKEEEKYSFTIGSDISFNIALSRCITEMMQGVNFKELKKKMVSNKTFEALEKKYDNSFKSYNWLRCFNNNNGYLTKNFFCTNYIPVSKLHFKDYLTNNKEVLEYLKYFGLFFIFIVVIAIITSLINLTGLKSITVSKLSVILTAISFLIIAIIASQKTKERGIIVGLKLGLSFILILILINLIIFKSPFNIDRLIYYIILITSSLLGGSLGKNIKFKKKKSRS